MVSFRPSIIVLLLADDDAIVLRGCEDRKICNVLQRKSTQLLQMRRSS
jgi:adenylate kinase